MPGKKQMLADQLVKDGSLTWLGQIADRLISRRKLVILTYHRICETRPDYPFDLELISASPEQFDWQAKWLASNADPITFLDLAEIEAGLRKMPKRPVIVTFDDGFDDNYQIASPILHEHGVPATFFVSTDYIGTERVFWYDWLAHQVLNPDAERISIESLDLDQALPSSMAERRTMTAALLNTVKRAPYAKQQLLIAELERSQLRDKGNQYRHLSRTMSWDNLREMSSKGMEIGSHGAAHLMLSKLDDAQLTHELTASKQTIEQHIGQSVCSIAYPVGESDACDERVFAYAQKAGYQYGCVFMPGANKLSSAPHLSLRRSPVEQHVTPQMFVCAAHFPSHY